MAKNNPSAPTVVEPPFLAQYRLVYPSVKKFYVTSDSMVFITEKAAQVHKRLVGGEIKTY